MNDFDDVLPEEALADAGPAATAAQGSLASRLARRAVLARLRCISAGRLTIADAMGRSMLGAGTTEASRAGENLDAKIRVNDLSAYVDIATGGTIGAAESYMAGKWTTTDLVALIRLFVANRAVMANLETGAARAGAPLLKALHAIRSNTRAGSRRNVRAHYDLGDSLFELFLDPTMMYSSAVFPRDDATLNEASVHKLDLICRKLALSPADHLLEIGTGWGGLAIHAARHYGCRVTTTTISANQLAFARRRVHAAGLDDRITVRNDDYRDLTGTYDKLVSIEMIEAVGLKYLDTYFRVCSQRLKPAGRMLLQAIVIADRNYQRARRSVDFIQKYIFPGGALPSVAAIMRSIASQSDLQATNLHDIGIDYARTLREWRERFMARVGDVRTLGYSDEFIRMWEWYLAYCEGGFRERAISAMQIVFDKPDCRLSADRCAI